MHESLQNILNLIEQSGALTAGQKQDLADWVKQVDKSIAITEFKLDRTEKVKRTTAILLEETIEELEQKRKAVEAQNRELEVEASLDRVRAEISSMRSTDDLQRITPLIWRELTALGVPFFRCGVFIIDEATELTHAFLSTPSGQAVAALHMKFDSAPFIHAAVQHWRQQQVYREKWNREQFVAWTQALIEQGMIESPEEYQAGGEAPEKLVLQFVPFTQGMLYIGSSAALSGDEIEIGQALAKAFGVAYARYEDFQRLEAAKAEVEAALENLKKTQDQLVQQEKLASLGQLTAGIAHEIKNPLNFVINFSRLSVELLDEARDEIKETLKADSQQLIAILGDIEANLRKIFEHGSRADGIVKSMLQHARAGDGKMEPTNLNTLIKEYVNLSFHGMRAGKNPIDVDFAFDLDDSISEVPLIAEDFSRVVLNLCNNAFDAMREKLLAASDQPPAYQPKLAVRTKSGNGKVIIEIEDNGPGIPEEIKDKILQPFFTTKKGTQGTGLGLSITNDIIKAHGGELQVKSHEGEGSVFTITLPPKIMS